MSTIIPTDDPWDALGRELDLWAAQGRRVRLWLRDDDAIAPGDQLDRLEAMAARANLPVLLAVIPLLAQENLPARLARCPLLRPCQHGARHLSHAPAGEKKAELGAHRPAAVVLSELAEGRQRMRTLFGDNALPVLVPPWNRIAPALLPALPAIGFSGLSCFRGFAPARPDGFAIANSDVDVMDWQGGRIGRRDADILAETTRLLAARREADQGDDTLGLLLHHRDHDPPLWRLLDRLLAALLAHPAIVRLAPNALFGAVPSLEGGARAAIMADCPGASSASGRLNDLPPEDAASHAAQPDRR